MLFPSTPTKVYSSTSALAMISIISLCLLFIMSTLSVPLQLAAPGPLKGSLVNASIANSASANAFKCFDSTFSPPVPSYPIEYSTCTDAADRLLANARGDVLSIFSRDEDADIQLPWRLRSKNCMMTVNVLNEDDEDIICLQDAHAIALALCRMCADGYYRYGGRTPVGARGVVFISVLGTRPLTIDATGSSATETSHIVARRVNPDFGPSLRISDNISSLSPTDPHIPHISTPDKGQCYNATTPSPLKHAYPIQSPDCQNAADELVKKQPAFRNMKFGRGASMDFRLPWTVWNETCIVHVDTRNDIDYDTLAPWEVYETALDRIEECTKGADDYGGRKAVGPRGVVWVYVFGVRPPPKASAAALAVPTHVVARV